MYKPITSLVANCRHSEIMRRFSFFGSGGCFGRDYAAWN
jgi:hypothetical protein